MARSRFELFIARRYLRAHRKEAVVSVITAISIIGVAAGVMALVIALAVNNGFRSTLQRNLLGAMAHVTVEPNPPGEGIENWPALAERIRRVPHVTGATPALYSPVFLSGPLQAGGAILKGIDVDSQLQVSDSLLRLKEGSLAPLRNPSPQGLPGIVLGARLAEATGMMLNSVITVICPQCKLTPMGAPLPDSRKFRVVGIFESGFFDIDNLWAYSSLDTTQRFLSLPNVVNQIEIRVDDINRAPEVSRNIEAAIGKRFTTSTWMERNRQILDALRMERAVTIITIGLIELVAALNIFITLVMMVMEKYRDIAILMSMGARHGQIRRIFMLQGVLIGVVGTAIGLMLGYSLSYFADKYRWIRLNESVYSLSFVPFEPRWTDGLWVAAAAILVSFLATLYPARNATRIAPAEVLRYE